MKLLMLGNECQYLTYLRVNDALAYLAPQRHTDITEQTEQVMRQHGASVYTSLAQALAEFQPDLAVIGVPNTTKNRFDVENSLLRHGVPIMEYKLRLRNIDDLRAFLADYSQQSVPIYIGEPYAYYPCVRKLREILRSGVLGKPEYLRWRCVRGEESCTWMTSYENLALEDLGLHHMSVLHTLFGLQHVSVTTRSLTMKKSEGITGAVCDSWLRWPDGLAASHSIDWVHALDDTDFFGTVALECEKGGALIRDEKLYVRLWNEAMREVALDVPPLLPLDEMTALLETGKQPEFLKDIRDFAPVMETIYAALQAGEGK